MCDISWGPHYRNKYTSLLNVRHMFLQNICYPAPCKLGTLFIQQMLWDSFNPPSLFYFIFPIYLCPIYFYMLEEEKEETVSGVAVVSYLKVKEAFAGEKLRANREACQNDWLCLSNTVWTSAALGSYLTLQLLELSFTFVCNPHIIPSNELRL